MTEAETLELIKTKKEDLAKRKAEAGVNPALLQTLEEEIKKLEATVPGAAPRKRPQQTFLDECAG
jgi:hypothetical protein